MKNVILYSLLGLSLLLGACSNSGGGSSGSSTSTTSTSGSTSTSSKSQDSSVVPPVSDDGVLNFVLERSKGIIGDKISYTVATEPSDVASKGYVIQSFDPGVATVENNIITCVAKGKAQIVCTINDTQLKAAAILEVIGTDDVEYPVKKISISSDFSEIEAGLSFYVDVKVYPDYATIQSYNITCNQRDIVDITLDEEVNKYKITALKAGNAMIYAESNDPTFVGSSLLKLKVLAGESEPYLTYSSSKTYNCIAGDDIVIDNIVAKINDEDATSRLAFTDSLGDSSATTYENNAIHFKPNVAGHHVITAKLENRNGSFKEIDVVANVSPQKAETFDTERKNVAIALTEGEYRENFEDGYKAPLLDKASYRSGIVVSGKSDAISGNSLIVDFSVLDGGGQYTVQLPGLSEYLYSTSYHDIEVKFDWKILSIGSPCDITQLYFGFHNNATNFNNDEKIVRNASATVGTTGTFTMPISYYKIKAQDTYFDIFSNYQDNTNCKLAIDNIVITNVETSSPAFRSFVPTMRDLMQGSAYETDWGYDFGYMFSEKNKIVSKSSVPSAYQIEMDTANTNLGYTWFNNNICHFYGSGDHWVGSGDNSLIYLFENAAGKTFNMELNYYRVNDEDLHVFFTKRSTGYNYSELNASVTTVPGTTNVRHVVLSGVVPEGATALNFKTCKVNVAPPCNYGDCSNSNGNLDIYFSSIRWWFTADGTTSSHMLSSSELANGYHYTGNKGSNMYMGIDSCIYPISYLEGSDYGSTIALNKAKFGEGETLTYLRGDRILNNTSSGQPYITAGSHRFEGLTTSSFTGLVGKTLTVRYSYLTEIDSGKSGGSNYHDYMNFVILESTNGNITIGCMNDGTGELGKAVMDGDAAKNGVSNFSVTRTKGVGNVLEVDVSFSIIIQSGFSTINIFDMATFDSQLGTWTSNSDMSILIGDIYLEAK